MRQPLDCLDARSVPGMTERRYRELVAKFGGVANAQTQPLISERQPFTLAGMTDRSRARASDVAEPEIGIRDSPFLTLAEGARFCRFDATAPRHTTEVFRQWLRRHNVPLVRRGRVLLVDKKVLETVLRDGGTR
jgi:hypothetical protein